MGIGMELIVFFVYICFCFYIVSDGVGIEGGVGGMWWVGFDFVYRGNCGCLVNE